MKIIYAITSAVLLVALIISSVFITSPAVHASNSASVSLNGNAHVAVPHQSAYNLSGSFTLETWVLFKALPSSGSIDTFISKGSSGDSDPLKQNNYYFGLSNSYLSTSGLNLLFGYENTSGQNFQVAKSFRPATNLWYHVAGVYDASAKSLSIYLNGSLFVTKTGVTGAVATNSNTITIGRLFADVNNNLLNGLIDEVRIWNVARTSSQISSSYNLELSGTETGLVDYWKFNQTSGTTAQSSGPANGTGQLAGATWSSDVPFGSTTTPPPPSPTPTPAPTPSPTPTPTAGSNTASVSLNGNAHVAVPHQSAYNLSGSFTLETWVLFKALPSSGSIDTFLSKGSSGDSDPLRQNNYYFGLSNSYLSTSGLNLLFGYENTSGQNFQVAKAFKPATNLWYHVAGVYDASAKSLSIYLNGSLFVTRTAVTGVVATNSNPITIGKLFTDVNNNLLNGYIDEVRIWNVARTSSQISSSYNLELSGTETGLVDYWKFNQTSGTTAQSSGPANGTGQLAGATWSSDVPFGRTTTPPPPPPSSITLTHGPILGLASPTSVRVWVRTSSPTSMHVRYKKAGVSSYDNSVTTNTLSSSDNTGVITISGLEANTTYDYRLVVNGTELASTASTFKTLPSTGQASSFSFTFGADVSYTRRPHTIFSAMNSKNPDFNLLIGDIMYSDSPTVSTTLSQYRTKYKENYSDSHLNSFMKTTPSLFMWDDHEIRNDWSSGKSGIYPIARQAFNEYVAAINPTPRVSGELYYSFNVGQASFYVMDPRSYRSANTATDNSSKTMLGATQKADFKNWLLNSNAKFKVIVSSVPFSDFGTTANDSWFGFKTERKEITDFISANNIKGVLLLVGDQHWSMVTRLDSLTNGSNLYEFMPTPLNTVMRTPTSSTDPRILFKQGNVHNYGHFSINTTVTPATLTYTNYDGNNNVLYRLTITEKNINP